MHKTRSRSRSRSRPKSGRKPLRDIHVSGKNVPSIDGPLKPRNNTAADSTVSGEGTIKREDDGDGVLDRLLLVRSELGSVIREIDELIAQAFQLEMMSEHGKEEAGALSSFLSEILCSLKPWSSRLKASLSSPQKSSGPIKPSSVIAVCSPEKKKFNSLISPSPLVSWRANCTIERGRQVFMLTPLPMSKALTSKFRKPPPSVFPKLIASTVPPLSLTLLEEEKDDAHEDDPPASFKGIGEEQSFVSPKPALRKPCSMVTVTPCFKVSPPKSCKLLDPSMDSSCWKDTRDRKPTPYPLGLRKYDGSQLSKSDEEGTSEELTKKFSELLTMQRNVIKGGNRGKEPSPEWLFSPPRTCILMEPSADKSLRDVTNSYQRMRRPDQASVKEKPVRCVDPRFIEKTPVWKGPERSLTRRPPGENTLKRELWTKFEAASTCNHSKSYASGSANSDQRGFIDRLDEVSLDE